MPALQMLITDAGLEAIINAQEGGTDAILIESIGLTDTPFVMAPTLTAIPGQFRVIETVSGQAVAESIIHVVAYDPAPVTYDVTGFGLFDGDGVLIAVYSAAEDPILSKAELATSLFAMDIVLSADVAAVIEFGDALFLNPPATEVTAGVAEISDNAEADAGVNDATMMTPKKVKRRIDAAIAAAIFPGFIAMWSGAIVNIPAGWRLCDGTNGTPNLVDRFIVAAGATYAVGATGGATQHNHGGAVHDHVLTEAQIPAHRHMNVVPGIGDGALGAGNSISQERTLGGDTQYIMSSAAGEPSIGRTSSTGGGGAHNHGLTINNSDHRPPYFALAYIMKV